MYEPSHIRRRIAPPLPPISRLRVEGLHERHDVDLDIKNAISIFMGPNGVGKSTVLNVFVYLLSRQWNRLSKQPFISATIDFQSGESVTVNRSDCLDFVSADLPANIQRTATRLAEAGYLQQVIGGVTEGDFAAIALESKSGLGSRDLRVLRATMQQYPQMLNSFSALSAASAIIFNNFPRKLLYLPTYRRIEQDITEVLSMAPSSMRRLQAEMTEFISHGSSTHTELVRFGMEDIEQLIGAFTADIKEYSRRQINSLSTRYLVAALGTSQTFDRTFFDALTDERISGVLARVDDEELSQAQRERLTTLIASLRGRQGAGRLSKREEHIASYFRMLADTHDRISSREIKLQRLADILNHYIMPSKQALYDRTRYQFVIKSGETDVPLSGLSSGEKQVFSLFATIALSQDEKYFVVIDEPELSLSVLWQEILLEDIMSLGVCHDLLAVTHSPFIYGDRLSKYTRDLGDHTRPRVA